MTGYDELKAGLFDAVRMGLDDMRLDFSWAWSRDSQDPFTNFDDFMSYVMTQTAGEFLSEVRSEVSAALRHKVGIRDD